MNDWVLSMLIIWSVGFIVNTVRIFADYADWNRDYDVIDVLFGPLFLLLDAIKVIVKALKRRYKRYKEH